MGRPRKNTIDSDRHSFVVEMYQSGKSLQQLADHFNVTVYVVKEVLALYNVKLKPRGREKVKPVLYIDLGLKDELLSSPLGE